MELFVGLLSILIAIFAFVGIFLFIAGYDIVDKALKEVKLDVAYQAERVAEVLSLEKRKKRVAIYWYAAIVIFIVSLPFGITMLAGGSHEQLHPWARASAEQTQAPNRFLVGDPHNQLPYAGWNDGFELTEWQTLSELFPEQHKPEDDYEEIES